MSPDVAQQLSCLMYWNEGFVLWLLSNVARSTVVLSNCVSDNSNFDTTFLPDCTKFCSVFSRCWIGNLMRNPKMCLK